MRRRVILFLVLTGSTLLAACGQATDTAMDDAREEAIVVYAAFEDDEKLRNLLAKYTEESGVLVIVRRGKPEAIVNDLIGNKISPPADLLLTKSVVEVWRAAEEGALRPVFSDVVRERSPAWSHDPDELWFGLNFRTAVIVHNMPALIDTNVLDFAGLAEQRFSDSVCLSSSANDVNRMVVAMMIEALGDRPAEVAVRGWMHNLAQPVFDTEMQLVGAIRAGSCRIGIASSTAVALARQDGHEPDLSILVPAETYADIDGIGVARHARNPDGAVKLLEWLFSKETQAASAQANLAYPVNAKAAYTALLTAAGRANVSRRNVGLVAWHEADARQLAKRAHYRE